VSLRVAEISRDKRRRIFYTGWLSSIPPPFTLFVEVFPVSIIRIGLAETKQFAQGYEAIFGKKKKEEKPAKAKDDAKKPAKAGKKKGKK
jgi:hypothetical protein